jgi:hypothetical protein
MAAGAGLVVATASVVTAWVVIKTAGLARETLKDGRRTRHAQLITQISQRWDDPEIIRASRLASEYSATGISELLQRLYAPKRRFRFGSWLAKRSREQDLETYFEIFLWPNLLESVGCLLIQEEALSKESVYGLWGAEIVGTWEDVFKEPIHRLRALQGDEGIYSYFEKLASEMARLREAGSPSLSS